MFSQVKQNTANRAAQGLMVRLTYLRNIIEFVADDCNTFRHKLNGTINYVTIGLLPSIVDGRRLLFWRHLNF